MKRTLMIFAVIFMGWLGLEAQSLKMHTAFSDGSSSITEISHTEGVSLQAVYGYVNSEARMYLIIYQGYCNFDEDWNLVSYTGNENGEILFKHPVAEIKEIKFEKSSGVSVIEDILDVVVKYHDSMITFSNVKDPLTLSVIDITGAIEAEVAVDGDISVDLSSLKKGIHVVSVRNRSDKNIFSSKIVVK